MTTYRTGNPLGSEAPQDLFDNSQNIDHAANDLATHYWDDRFGRPRLTWAGIEDRARIDIEASATIATAEAAGYRNEAQQARDDAISAASASGDFIFVETFADALGAQPLPEGKIVEVGRDETRDGSRVRYIVENNELRFAINLSTTATSIDDVAGLQDALDDKQKKLGYTPLNKAGDTIEGNIHLLENGSSGSWALAFAANSGGPINVFWQVIPDQDYYLMFKDENANALLAIGVNGPSLFHRRPVFAGNTPWDSGNFDPNSKVSSGTEVKHLTGAVEFGSIITNASLNTVDLPAPYVVTGLSGSQGSSGNLFVTLRGRKLYV
ncbi:hypothetical protein LQZ44_11920 [Alcaligenes nematophilus]|uniref:hypothetical protein n=1 Tax=Alcaligenes nematophilus TaxID=2994643 RepID=UPI0035B534D4